MRMKKETPVNNSNLEVRANLADTAHSVAAPPTRRPTWEGAGNPLPLGVKWIEEEQAFNFAVYSEHAESVTLLLYPPGREQTCHFCNARPGIGADRV
jgi:hypothetical protein